MPINIWQLKKSIKKIKIENLKYINNYLNIIKLQYYEVWHQSNNEKKQK